MRLLMGASEGMSVKVKKKYILECLFQKLTTTPEYIWRYFVFLLLFYILDLLYADSKKSLTQVLGRSQIRNFNRLLAIDPKTTLFRAIKHTQNQNSPVPTV